jgi:predicted phosphodiesterase
MPFKRFSVEGSQKARLRIAVISDIHGNRFALDAAISDMRGRSIGRVVCLGDTVQGGPQPRETVRKLREMKIPIVMGNADAWLLSGESDTAEKTSEEQKAVRRWTLSQLPEGDLDFLRTYRPTVEIKLDKKHRLLCFHGSPGSFDDVLLPDTPQARWDQLLGEYSPAIMAGGHTHAQQLRRVREGMFFNPGSIGVVFNALLPDDGRRLYPWAEYAILTYERGFSSLEFRHAPYDVEEFIDVVKASGRPYADKLVADYS